MTDSYPRDLVGYGATPPHPRWPNNAKLAIQFVVNYEEGGENCVLHGDEASEAFLSEIVGAAAYKGVRHPSMESIYEYGSRAGVWRLLRIFNERELPLTVFAVGMAMERNPDPILAFKKAGHEIASHGYRWIDYQWLDPEIEREHIRLAVAAHERILGPDVDLHILLVNDEIPAKAWGTLGEAVDGSLVLPSALIDPERAAFHKALGVQVYEDINSLRREFETPSRIPSLEDLFPGMEQLAG